MVNANTTATEKLTRTLATVAGRQVEICTWKDGRTEVYVEYADQPGMMQFRGYYDDLCVSSPRVTERVQPVVVAHLQAHREFWAAYLPGAARWLNAA